MKALLMITMILTGCATTPEAYEAGKALWEEQKVAWGCVQVPGEFEDPRGIIRDGGHWGPSLVKYTKWQCEDGKPRYSPYEFFDAKRQVPQQLSVPEK